MTLKKMQACQYIVNGLTSVNSIFVQTLYLGEYLNVLRLLLISKHTL